jgi:PhnB protein
MGVQVYLNFNGNCKEAVEYYAKVFGTEEPRIMTFGDMPPGAGAPITEEMKSLVLHAEIVLNSSVIMFSDTMPGMQYVVGNNVNLIYNSESVEVIKSYFNKLAEEGTITMELDETFWSKCYGMLTDKYGVNWMFSHSHA